MASKLPLDVLQIIFTFIRKSEKKKLKAIGNLHSCLLVNRQWCEATIPLLCFDYAKMLKRLDYDNFCHSVDNWCGKLIKPPYNVISLVIKALLRLFLTHSAVLIHLVIGEWTSRKSPDFIYLKFTEKEFEYLFEPIRKLEIQGEFVKDRLLTGLKEPCKNIEKLFVYIKDVPPNYEEELHSLQQFVKEQRCLKSLKVANVASNFLFPTIATQANTLRCLYLWGLNFTNTDNYIIPWHLLLRFKNLEKLKFRNCIGFDQHMKDSLINGNVEEMVVVERDKSGNINDNLIVNGIFKNLKMIAIIGQCKTLNNEYIFEDDIKELIDWGVGQGAIVFLGHFHSADAFFKEEKSLLWKVKLEKLITNMMMTTFTLKDEDYYSNNRKIKCQNHHNGEFHYGIYNDFVKNGKKPLSHN
ncbi:16670_t:CDS:2 [Entrophospora sp. SA101]|nr:16670_t:CDS:2 [Entrophospora sp. SA101]